MAQQEPKKAWVMPELMILVRSKPEEAVLSGCKFITSGKNGPGSTVSTCRVTGNPCNLNTAT
jgi:hypothetical protein